MTNNRNLSKKQKNNFAIKNARLNPSVGYASKQFLRRVDFEISSANKKFYTSEPSANFEYNQSDDYSFEEDFEISKVAKNNTADTQVDTVISNLDIKKEYKDKLSDLLCEFHDTYVLKYFTNKFGAERIRFCLDYADDKFINFINYCSGQFEKILGYNGESKLSEIIKQYRISKHDKKRSSKVQTQLQFDFCKSNYSHPPMEILKVNSSLLWIEKLMAIDQIIKAESKKRGVPICNFSEVKGNGFVAISFNVNVHTGAIPFNKGDKKVALLLLDEEDITFKDYGIENKLHIQNYDTDQVISTIKSLRQEPNMAVYVCDFTEYQPKYKSNTNKSISEDDSTEYKFHELLSEKSNSSVRKILFKKSIWDLYKNVDSFSADIFEQVYDIKEKK